MKFLIESNDVVDSAVGELTYHIREVSLDDGVVSQAHLFLAISRFFSDITKITCDIGVFQSLDLVQISGSTAEETMLYELVTHAFSLNIDRIESLLGN